MDLDNSLLNFNFFMVHITDKILVLIHMNHVNYIKDNIFKLFLKCITGFVF